MKYLKHYWKSTETGDYVTTTNTIHKRHPEAEFAGLDVQIWLHDADGIDVCMAQVPDSTTITEVTVGSKKAIQELTETQYNTVKTPLDAAITLEQEAAVEETGGNATLAATKRTEAETKRAEAKTALLAL